MTLRINPKAVGQYYEAYRRSPLHRASKSIITKIPASQRLPTYGEIPLKLMMTLRLPKTWRGMTSLLWGNLCRSPVPFANSPCSHILSCWEEEFHPAGSRRCACQSEPSSRWLRWHAAVPSSPPGTGCRDGRSVRSSRQRKAYHTTWT